MTPPVIFFSGQGAQKIGMARDWIESSETARDLAAVRLNPWWFSHDALYTPANDGTGGPFTIGRVIHSSRSVGFTGWIGGVAVFNRALSPTELNQLSALSRERPVSAPPRP